MKKLILGLIALGGLALLVLLGPWQAAAPPASVSEEAVGRPPSLAAASRPGEGIEEEPVSRKAIQEEPAAQPPTLLQGRCVAAEDGRPLGGCTLTVWARVFGWEWKEFDPKVWTPPPQAITAADGRFAIPLAVPPEPFGLGLKILAQGRVPVAASWRSLERGTTHDLGDVALVAGARVTGVVVDPRDAPLAGVGLWAFVGPSAEGVRFRPSGNYQATSGEDGGLSFLDPWPPGVYTLHARDGYELVEGASVAVAAGAADVRLRVVARRPDPGAILSGIVVDENGQPVAGAKVMALNQKGQASPAVASAEDGSFALSCTGDRSLPVGLHCTPLEALRSYSTRWDYCWGAREIRLVVPRLVRAAGFPLEVVAAATGKPVTDYYLLLAKDSLAQSNWRFSQVRSLLAGGHPEGRAFVPDLEPTPHQLVVVPRDEALAANTPIRIDPAAQRGRTLRVALEPPVPLAVRVRFRDGRPAAGTKVVVLEPLGEGQSNGMADGAVPLQPYRPDPMESLNVGALSWGQAATDEAGEARFSVAAGSRLAIHVLGPGHIPEFVEGGLARGGGAAVEIGVSLGATLMGRVVPAAIVERLDPACRPGNRLDRKQGELAPGLVLRGPGGRRLAPPGKGAFPIAPDGTFRVEGVPPGEWDVNLFWWAETAHGSCQGLEAGPPLGRLSLLDGERRELELDARSFLPGSVRGRILLDGIPVPGATWTLFVEAGGERNLLQVAGPPTDTQGEFHAAQVPPGSCWLRVEAVLGGRQETLYAEERFTVHPGQETLGNMALRRAALRIRLLASADPSPLAGRTLHLRSAALPGEEILRTDGEGKVLLDPAPPGEIEVYLRSPETPEAEWQALPWEGRRERLLPLGTLQAELGKTLTEAVLRVPPSAR